MCLINFHINNHPRYKLIIAANRDEFYQRPTDPAHFWEDHPAILAGRDLLQMGTWLGITKQGQFAALTNFRDPEMQDGTYSRGKIITDYLTSSLVPEDFLHNLQRDRKEFAGFNVLLGSPDQLFHYNNVYNEVTELSPGTHGLSNDTMNTPWPKVVKGKKNLRDYVMENECIDPDRLFDIVTDAEEAAENELPDTGVGAELERKLSPLFIQTPEYGTRSSTVLLVDHQDNITFVERTYQQGDYAAEQRFSFQLER
ncbi:NRDE family protein [Lentibacillus sediminis]|uniref:NRDE family protein n=1 Tax=Lentibacillus sediminis TaxID=1940529 RepID=UPI000C1C5024|nr:NRDE family protein [Lentibacillus sediminis]